MSAGYQTLKMPLTLSYRNHEKCHSFPLGSVAFVVVIRYIMPNTHRRRDETLLSRRVGVGGVYMNSQLADDDCRRI